MKKRFYLIAAGKDLLNPDTKILHGDHMELSTVSNDIYRELSVQGREQSLGLKSLMDAQDEMRQHMKELLVLKNQVETVLDENKAMRKMLEDLTSPDTR